jgi:predicted transcriptional regulator
MDTSTSDLMKQLLCGAVTVRNLPSKAHADNLKKNLLRRWKAQLRKLKANNYSDQSLEAKTVGYAIGDQPDSYIFELRDKLTNGRFACNFYQVDASNFNPHI